MKTLSLYLPDSLNGSFTIPTSKSFSNRALILKAIFPQIQITGLSEAADTQTLAEILNTPNNEYNVGHAGTAMRFATAYFACKEGKTTLLRGSKRMHERPIAPLVNALRKLNAEISYLGKDGFPPLQIEGKNLEGGTVYIDASMSSQYITALVLIGLCMDSGLTLKLEGKIVSKPYLDMTIAMVRQIGGQVIETRKTISIAPIRELQSTILNTPGDWSSAAYGFAHAAAATNAEVFIPNLEYPSNQADAAAVEIFKSFGVVSISKENGLLLSRKKITPRRLSINCLNFPDLVPAIAATAGYLSFPLSMTGLETLRIKETDRIEAIATELRNFGIGVTTTESSMQLNGAPIQSPLRSIKTYEDHRIAMAFSIFAHRFPIKIENPDVVQKSFPNFWDSLNAVYQR